MIFTGDNLVFRAGYGSSKDVSMYSSLGRSISNEPKKNTDIYPRPQGLTPENIHIVGKLSKKQLVSCDSLAEGYAAHLAELSAPGPGSRPAQGNARMVVPRSSVVTGQ